VENTETADERAIDRNRHRLQVPLIPPIARLATIGALCLFGLPGPSPAAEAAVTLEEILVIDTASAGLPLGNPVDVACNRRTGEILVADTDAGHVAVFGRGGEPIGLLGRDGELRQPVGVAVGPDGVVYVSERGSGTLKVFGAARRTAAVPELVLSREGPGEGPPTAGRMAVAPDGRLCVVDGRNGRIRVLDPRGEGRQVRLGPGGSGDGRFSSPRDVAVDGRGWIYVAARGADPLTAFDREGVFLHVVRDLRMAVEDVSDPVGLRTDSRNRLWVLDAAREEVRIYGPVGQHLHTITGKGFRGGLFLPVDIEIDAFDRVLILERGAGRVRVFEPRF
jgi:DNA-binding beta-propeller fold protein YncE